MSRRRRQGGGCSGAGTEKGSDATWHLRQGTGSSGHSLAGSLRQRAAATQATLQQAAQGSRAARPGCRAGMVVVAPFSVQAVASSRVKCGSCMSTGSRCHRPCVAIWLISMAAAGGVGGGVGGVTPAVTPAGRSNRCPAPAHPYCCWAAPLGTSPTHSNPHSQRFPAAGPHLPARG